MAVVAVSLGACGSSGPQLTADQRQAANVALGYVRSLASGNGAGVCADIASRQLAPLEQLAHARGVSCATLMSAAGGGAGGTTTAQMAHTATATAVIEHGTTAAVVVKAQPANMLAAMVKESGRWKLAQAITGSVTPNGMWQMRVPSDAMKPTFTRGALASIDPLAYLTAKPRLGEIVAFHPPAVVTAPPSASSLLSQANPLCGRTVNANQLCPMPKLPLGKDVFLKRVVAGPGDTRRSLARSTSSSPR